MVIAVFHTNASHVTLHDSSYNIERNIQTRNPIEDLVADLVKQGLQIDCPIAVNALAGGDRERLYLWSKVDTHGLCRHWFFAV
jgi:hypothetical protein